MKKEKEYVKKRRSYYSFSKYYPGKIGSKTYIIGDSVEQKRREIRRRILIALLLVLLFIVSFIVTSVCFEISEMKPINSLCGITQVLKSILI